MSGTDALEDASADHERFEAELVAQDQDAARVAVADIDDGRAHALVNDLPTTMSSLQFPTNGSSSTSQAMKRSTRFSNSRSSIEAGSPLATSSGEDSDATNALWLCLLRCGSRYRSWDGVYLGKRRTGHAPNLRRLRGPVESDPDDRDHHACDSCGLIVDALAALTRFRVELGHLKADYSCVRDVVPAAQQCTGLATSRNTSLMSLESES